jgi:hypothetical protein
LFLIYLFTFYPGFIVQWGDYLSSAGAMAPFILYAFSGILVSVAFVVFVFREEGMRFGLNWRREQTALQEFERIISFKARSFLLA